MDQDRIFAPARLPWTAAEWCTFKPADVVQYSGGAYIGWKQLNQAKNLREEQTRPFVVIDLGSSAHPFFDLVVTNVGPTMARDVSFHFDPPIKTTDDKLDPNKMKMFRDGISSLAPGRELRTLFDRGPNRFESGLPDTYEVTVTYSDQTGKRPYKDKMDLDFGLYWEQLNVRRKGMHEVHGELENIRKEMAKWSANPGPGLAVATPDDIEKRNEANRQQLRERRAKQGRTKTEDPDPGS